MKQPSKKNQIKSKDDFLNELEKDWVAIDNGLVVPGPVKREYFETEEVAVLVKKEEGL